MRRKTRIKMKKSFVIISIIIGLSVLTLGTIILIKLSKGPRASYQDGIVCKNYFSEITIDLKNKRVKRDDKNTSLIEEFGLTKDQEVLCFSSEDELRKRLKEYEDIKNV